MDMRIAGSGTIPPGEYDKVTMRGSGRLFGEVQCTSFSASGSCKGESIACAEGFKASGRAAFSKNIKAKNIRASGSFSCDGNLAAEELLRVFGSLHAGGSVEAKSVHIVGGLECEGALRAEDIMLQADKLMSVGSMRGNTILLKRKRVSIFPKRRVIVSAAIEADAPTLEYVTCPRVTGRVVVIGKGCKIDLVQYSEEIQISPKATVGKVEKI